MNLIQQSVDTQAAIRAATVEVTIKRSPCFMTYHIVGEPDAVQDKVNALLRQYDPRGYGTYASVHGRAATVIRALSCE